MDLFQTQTKKMKDASKRPLILFFIARLTSGGKERRLIELLTYLKKENKMDLMLVVTKDHVHYQHFFSLDIPYLVIKKSWRKQDPTLWYKFYKICRQHKPDLIHTWGRMQTFYALPAVAALRIPLVNGQITAAPPVRHKWSFNYLVDCLNFRLSNKIVANSEAGLQAYCPPASKARVIYNGINLKRFTGLPAVEATKAKYNIQTPYTVVMAASFTPHKDYELFFRVAQLVTARRNDVTFIGVGAYDRSDAAYRRMLQLSKDHPRILFPGRIDDVEALVQVSNIGVLFSNKAVHGEGIPNAVMEYMSLSKPVIANDAGGTRELVRHGQNGYLITHQSEETIVAMMNELIDDQQKAAQMGLAGRHIIEENFSLAQMGLAFANLYAEVLQWPLPAASHRVVSPQPLIPSKA